MHSFFYLSSYIALALSLSSLALSAPHSVEKVQSRSVVDCTDINADFDESCWDTLDLTNWLNNWSPPLCNATQTTAHCCDPSWEWSTCFLKMGIKPGYNCTTISQDTCAFSPSMRDIDLAPSVQPQVRYILLNIFYVHAFFNDWFTAVNGATGAPAAGVIDAIIQEVDPQEKTHSVLNDILTALSIGLAFIPEFGPELSAAASVGTKVASVAAKALRTGIQKAPGVAQQIWPSGTIDTQAIQISDLNQELASMTTDLESRMNAGLHEVMYNKSSFAAFASSGLFSGADAPSIPDDQDTLLVGFKTFLITKAMSANKWFSRVSPGLENMPEQINGCWPTAADGTCFWNPDSKLQYTIWNTDHTNLVKQLSTDIVQKGWSNYPLMFQGSVDCAAMGGYNDGGKMINFKPDGTLDLSCFAQLDTCADWWATDHAGQDYTQAPCIVNPINGWCPIRTCRKFENDT